MQGLVYILKICNMERCFAPVVEYSLDSILYSKIYLFLSKNLVCVCLSLHKRELFFCSFLIYKLAGLGLGSALVAKEVRSLYTYEECT